MDKPINTASLIIMPQMLSLIAEADKFNGVWRPIGKPAPDHQSALRRVATIERVGSSTYIEGSNLSDRDFENQFAVSSSALGGPDAWIDPDVGNAIFLNDRIARALK